MSIPQSIKSINQTSTALNPEGEKTSEKKKEIISIQYILFQYYPRSLPELTTYN